MMGESEAQITSRQYGTPVPGFHHSDTYLLLAMARPITACCIGGERHL